MKQFLWGALAAALMWFSGAAGAQTAKSGDERILAARDAIRNGDRAALEWLAASTENHVLNPYVRYWLLFNKLARPEPPPAAELSDFLLREAGSMLADRLRGDWLRRMAKDGDWAGFVALYPDLVAPDAELRCLGWTARLMTGDRAVLDEVARQWMDLVDSHAACETSLRATLSAGLVGEDEVWWRIRRQVEGKNPAQARTTLTWLPATSAPLPGALEQALNAPAPYLDRLPPNFAITRAGRELALAALVRLARDDLSGAYSRLIRLQDRLETGERAYAYAALALRAAFAQQPDAVAWFQADQSGFYGLLAAEELGRPFAPPLKGGAITAADLRQAESDLGLQRALALFRLDMRTEGVREWNWSLRNQTEAFTLAAARIALDAGIYDRAINTAERGNPNGNFEMRFLTPYRQLIEPQVRGQGLDLSWVYGLMRQESRFVVPARSSSGAQGLMQVMPATGKWVAAKIGMRGYHPGLLSDPDTNVQLGTSYMRMILEDLDNHPVLASAGYNAGPSRAKRWRDAKPLEGAIYAETIPFDETRDYVKKVMTNTVIYAAMLEGRPQSLKTRLGTIAARN